MSKEPPKEYVPEEDYNRMLDHCDQLLAVLMTRENEWKTRASKLLFIGVLVGVGIGSVLTFVGVFLGS